MRASAQPTVCCTVTLAQLGQGPARTGSPTQRHTMKGHLPALLINKVIKENALKHNSYWFQWPKDHSYLLLLPPLGTALPQGHLTLHTPVTTPKNKGS